MLRHRVDRRRQGRYVKALAERPQGVWQDSDRGIAGGNGAQRDDQSERAERIPDCLLSATGVDVPPEGETADRADQCCEGERAVIGEKAPVKRETALI
jgi:hypothetical protein